VLALLSFLFPLESTDGLGERLRSRGPLYSTRDFDNGSEAFERPGDVWDSDKRGFLWALGPVGGNFDVPLGPGPWDARGR